MIAFRLISLSMHGALELLVGLAVIVAPFALGFGDPATATSIAIGAVIMGVALGAASGERAGLSVASHFAFDQAVVVALGGLAIGLAIADDAAAAVFFAATAALQLALTMGTRYSRGI